MAENFGTGVSYVNEGTGYNYDTVVFQKGKPPLDSELNLVQQLQRIINQRQLTHLPSGWLSLRPFYTSPFLTNKFYTQNPSGAIPEYALVNGQVIHVTNTGTSEPNANLIDLGAPPKTGNKVNGVFLEVWRALLDPNTSNNKPDPITVIDSILDIDVVDDNHAWAVGENGLVLGTENGGQSWNVQLSNTQFRLNGVSFINSTIGWVAGNNGTILRTSSGGVRWSTLMTGITENLNAVHAINQLTAWVVGDAGTILKTVNGVNFTHLTSGVTANLRGVYFHDPLVGWVVGSNGTILKTTNGGTSWTKIPSGTTKDLNSVFFYDLNFGFIVGDNGTILRTSDGGATWVSQSANIWNGTEYVSITSRLNDVTMAPSLDEYVDGEEVSGQFDGTNKNCTVMYVPVTKGDGTGTVTNNVTDIVVKVNGVQVPVVSLSGATGQIVLSVAPRACDTVKVYYYHKVPSGIFRGRVWVVGEVNSLTGSTKATVLRTDDLGATWIIEDPKTAYTLNAIAFSNRSIGWTGGNYSIIRYTTDGGDTWSVQQSEAISRETQRVYNEGNLGTPVYLMDDSVHPDTNIETTKRVQIQYRIRVIDSVDPMNYPDAGLGMTSVVGLGPNTTGVYPFENMGPVSGDYGLWRAKCPNTVDGYCWAIPMFFVNRRNSSAYDPATNSNGSNQPNTAFIRPDLLTAERIVDADILDVRRISVVPDAEELLNQNFDLLSSGALRTSLFRGTMGGDHYGTELLQVDRISGTSGGQLINKSTISDAVSGQLTSNAELRTISHSISAGTSLPSPVTILPPSDSKGYFVYDISRYSAKYTSSSSWNNKPVPGRFSGMGTDIVTFTFSPKANTQNEDPGLIAYEISADYIYIPLRSLNKAPSSAHLVKNFSGTSSEAFFYQGVMEDSVMKIIEQWDSGIPNKPNYTVVYPCKDASDPDQRARASTVELHYFLKLTSTNIINVNKISFGQIIRPVQEDVPYVIHTISRINNIDSGFSYKIVNQFISDKVYVESAPGFPFLEGMTIEIIGSVLSDTGNANVRNGASVNFIAKEKSIRKFCCSEILSTSLSTQDSTCILGPVNGLILGVSSTETVDSMAQAIMWQRDSTNLPYTMRPVTVTGFNTPSITLSFNGLYQGEILTQVMYQQTTLPFPDDNNRDGIFIGYSYVPYQGISELPETVTIEFITKPRVINISNLGAGGGTPGLPYTDPIEHIPLNDPTLTDEKIFANLEPMLFNNFSIDGGFVQLPAYVPANTSGQIILSNPVKDKLDRAYYKTCSREMVFMTEGLVQAVPRKIYIAAIVRVVSTSDNKLTKGECLLAVLSRHTLNEKENYTGYKNNSDSVIALYRLPNKPIIRR